MEFTSLSFLLFVPIFFALYWMSAKRLRIQNMLVVTASYTFYGWWSWEFLWLLLATTVTSYSAGLLIDRQQSHRRLWLVLCIVINLGILAYFKYFNFFVESLRSLLLSVTDLQADWFSIEVLLPVGISFYTFQALSYAIDVYRGKITATRDILAFASYISFFPQLVAGPIERSTSLLPQFLRHRHLTMPRPSPDCARCSGAFSRSSSWPTTAHLSLRIFWQYRGCDMDRAAACRRLFHAADLRRLLGL